MAKYLYGASVQGIQGFIFETNKLKEIVGASELIEYFCSLVFLANFSKEFKVNITKNNILRHAGGNIRISFDNKGDAEAMVKFFPQYLTSQAYGITLSQAVVEFSENDNYIDKKDELEYKLTKARNQATIPLDSRFSLMLQTSRTGKPAYEYKNEEYFDKGNWQKNINADEGRLNILLDKLELKEIVNKFPVDMEKISNTKNKVAVIHADGNKMGLMLQQMNKDLEGESTQEIQEVFKTFSTQITNATNSAVKEAFEKNFSKDDDTIKFRPIVIGGDDVTVICSADNALGFTKDYLIAFEEHTKKNFKEHNLSQYAEKLTACAGISFCNHKFPFHYAVSLAEELCGYAKKESERKASCLVFHNIQSSFFTDYKVYVKNELVIKYKSLLFMIFKSHKWSTDKKSLTLKDYQYQHQVFLNVLVKLQFAPYYVEEREDKPTVDNLQKLFELFDDSDIPFGKYREWLSELHKSREYAELFLERIDAVMNVKLNEKKYNDLNNALKKLHSELSLNNLITSKNKTPMQDIVQLKSVLDGRA